jgi:hypothetical protein
MSSRLDDRIRTMMQQVVDESPPPPDLPTGPPPAPVPAWRLPNWAVAVGAAVTVFALIGGVLWLIGGTGTDVIEEPSSSTTTTLSLDEPAGVWNPILSTTVAREAPAAATCPPGTDPSVPGPADQERPEAGWTGNLAAAFDRHTGRIVYVDTLGETWTFDVCTNTWHRMNPTGAPIGELSGLVYDVDSDVTVALGSSYISVYDANTNTWTQPNTKPSGVGFSGGVYDPATGLIIVGAEYGDDDLWAYDVDSNTWTPIGPLGDPQDQEYSPGDFLGYSRTLDRLILTWSEVVDFASDRYNETTTLVDPRSGEATAIATETPDVQLWWPAETYGPAGDTVYVTTWNRDSFLPVICGFDTSTLTWSACFDTPADLQNSRYYTGRPIAMVGDPINQRLILINGNGGARVSGVWWSDLTLDVWAIDLDTGEWTQILAPSPILTPSTP